MFNVLQKWLIHSLGIDNCLNLNFNNIGERFKDGVLFAHLLKKYQVIPVSNDYIFNKTNNYAVCLNNMKNINRWLKFLGIRIEDSVIFEIACGQSLSVTTVLYKIYFKFEVLKQHHIFDNISTKSNKQFNNIMTDVCINDKSHINDLSCYSNQKNRIKRQKIPDLNNEKYDIPKLYCDLEDIQYTDSKSIKNNNASKCNILNFMQQNMNEFLEIFKNKFNNKFFEKELIETSNELFNIFNIKEEHSTTTDKLESNQTYPTNNSNNQKNMYDKNLAAIQLNKCNKQKVLQNIKCESYHLQYTSQEDLINENSTLNNFKMEESMETQNSDQNESKYLVNQDTLYDYLHHTGQWSSDYLKVQPFMSKQNILAMIIHEVLNFEDDKSEIRCIKIKKTNLAGVIDVIHNAQVVELMKANLENRDILGFTADDALSACLNAYKEEMETSIKKGKLYQVIEYEHQIITKKPSDNIIQKQNSDAENIKSIEITKITENSSINISNNNTESESKINSESYERLKINKLTQTPEYIPEPDYDNPVLSSLAILGKLIHEKQIKNHNLQIGDIINCIGEFINQNKKKNGWILLEFTVQPLQMALLEYKLTGKLPLFGKEICEQIKKKSYLVPEYHDSEYKCISNNTYLSNCIKIVNHKNDINDEKWNDFLQFYKEQNCIQVLKSHLNNNMTEYEEVADILVKLILNKEHKSESEKLFTSINIFSDNENDENQESDENDELQMSNFMSIIIDDKSDVIITNEFQLSTNLSLNGGNLKTYMCTALYLCNKWETMESKYMCMIQELLNSKDDFFKDVKIIKDLVIDTVNQTIKFHNPSIMNLVEKFEDKTQHLLTNNTKKLEENIFELQTSLWDEVDSELEQIKQFIKHTIDQQIINDKNTLINIYKKLLEVELKRATTTLNCLKRYYDNINHYKIKEFDFCTNIDKNNDKTDEFQTLCSEINYKFENYVYDNYDATKIIDREELIQSVKTEKDRFLNQICRIKASMLLDINYLNDLTRIDYHLQKINNYYQFKINDINNLCDLIKYMVEAGNYRKGQIRQTSGKFYIKELSVIEIICKQIFHSENNFNIQQLRIIVNQLLDNAPSFKISMNDLINTLNELSKIQNIYPQNWPTNSNFYNHLLKEIFGDNISNIDWRDFIVQCMELPYPTIEQLLFYRQLFQENDAGYEMISVEIYETTKLWFENKSNQNNEAKWLLYDMYQVQNKLNYSNMLLAFCKDKQPWMGLGKSFSLVFGWNPFDLKSHINLFDYHHEENEIDLESFNNNDINSSDLSEQFFFDKNIMMWFLVTNLKMYTSSEKLLGNIDISQIVESVFELVKTKEIKPTITNLFQNSKMDNLYSEIRKFQTRELSKVVKTAVIKFII